MAWRGSQADLGSLLYTYRRQVINLPVLLLQIITVIVTMIKTAAVAAQTLLRVHYMPGIVLGVVYVNSAIPLESCT